MAYNWSHYVTLNQTAKLGDRLVLLVLAECADVETGSSFPSVGTLAKRTLMSERQVQRCLQNLERLELVTIRKNASEWGTNIYTLSDSLRGGDILSGVTNRTENMSEMSPKPSYKPSEKKETRAREKEVPEDWYPDDEGIQYCESRALDVDKTREDFIQHHRARGNKFVRIDMAWMKWCRTAVEINRRYKHHETITTPQHGWATPQDEDYLYKPWEQE